VLIDLDTVSVGKPSARMADPSSGQPRRLRGGEFQWAGLCSRILPTISNTSSSGTVLA
jgi:hypothetical protein